MKSLDDRAEDVARALVAAAGDTGVLVILYGHHDGVRIYGNTRDPRAALREVLEKIEDRAPILRRHEDVGGEH